MRRKLLWIFLVFALLCLLGIRTTSAGQPGSAVPLNLTGAWFPQPEELYPGTVYYFIATKKPSEEQGKIVGFFKWYAYYPDSSTIERWPISGWYISNYFEFSATNPHPEDSPPYWPVSYLFRGIMQSPTEAEADWVDSNGMMGEITMKRALGQ